MLVVYPHCAPRRASHEKRRNFIHDELLRRASVVENYNIMGVAKAALEAAVRYIAAELGPKGIRVHAISPGPLSTRAASGIPEFDELLEKARSKAPARSLVTIDDVGMATAFLALDAAKLITGDTIFIDGGYHIID